MNFRHSRHMHHAPYCALSRSENTSTAPSPAAYTVAVDDCQQWLKLKMTSCPIDFSDISRQRFIFQYIFLITMAAVDDEKCLDWDFLFSTPNSGSVLGVDVNTLLREIAESNLLATVLITSGNVPDTRVDGWNITSASRKLINRTERGNFV